MRRFVFLALAIVCGCGGSADKLSVVPVTGTVTKSGKALADVRVTLAPVDDKSGAPLQVGLSGADGKFEIQTSAGQKGAVPGRYKVVLTSAAATAAMDYSKAGGMGKKGPEANTEVIPKSYQSSVSTPLTVTVEEKTGAVIDAKIE